MAHAFWIPVFVFHSPYAAVAGLTIAHGFQYLLLIGAVAGGARRPTKRATNLLSVLVVVLILGGILSRASHLHGGAVGSRLLYGAFLGVAMSHFVVDAGLWRLRDTFSRQFLESRVPWLVPCVDSIRLPIDRQPI
jgi:hypothetical protein